MTSTPAVDGVSRGSIPAELRRAGSGRAARVGCTVAVYGRVAAIMAGKKQKRGGDSPISLAEALTATRSARTRVLALAARLEATERAILAAMAPAPPPAAKRAAPTVQPGTPAKRPVGRPRTRPLQGAPAPARAPGRKPSTSGTPGRRPVGRPPKS